jgi:dipeptidyl-peptidase 4
MTSRLIIENQKSIIDNGYQIIDFMKTILKVIFTGFFVGSVILAQAQNQTLTLEQIYGKGLMKTRGISAIKWLPEGNAYLTLERNDATGGRDVVKYDAETGKREVLLAAAKFIPADGTKPLTIASYTWSEDNSKLLIFTNTRKVWRQNTKGDYWVLDQKSGTLQKIGKGLPEASLMFAKFSPDGQKVAYVSNLNIYIENLADGIINEITHDGGGVIINGTFDWLYEEEFDCRDGFRWSPDGKYIAYWQTDTKGTGIFYMVNDLDSIYPSLISIPYPKVGTTVSAVKVGVVSSLGGETRWFDIPGDPRDHYIPRMEFIPGSNDLMIQQMNRLQNINIVWSGNAETIKLSNLFTESDSSWVDVYDNTKWLKGSKFFTWTSERDGWRHLYMVSRDGKDFRLITKGDFDIISIQCIDENGGYVYYNASPDNFTEQYLYRSRLDGKGKAERVTPAGNEGTHQYNISPNGKWATHTFQNCITPSVTEMVSLPGHSVVKVFEENKSARDEFKSLGLQPKQFFKINLPDVTLDGWMIKPPGFDSSKIYPVIFEVYGEPASSTVQNSWGGGDQWHQYLAQQGYIIISVDNRGTRVPRGHEWRKSIYRQVGILASKDQADAVVRIGEMYPFVDMNRIGIWGWSGGGSMTLNAMFRYPELYKTGIAVAFVSDQKLYDAVYQERYMGLPSGNPGGYRDGSPINYAKNLKGNLLLIHGTGDDNVHYQNCDWLIDELVKQGKQFDMVAYPMRTHNISEREGTTLHLHKTMERYWKEHLEPGPKER